MSAARGRANHKLYLARVLIGCWELALQAQETPASVLAQAFEEPVRKHLIDAYGWFLLEIIDPAVCPDRPLRGCVDLAPPAEGRAVPGEVREFQQLEQAGWLSELLSPARPLADVSRSQGNLAQSGHASPTQLLTWSEELQELFDRMSNSLDEY